jgi:hypothetical protein
LARQFAGAKTSPGLTHHVSQSATSAHTSLNFIVKAHYESID